MRWIEEDRAYWRQQRWREFFDSAGWIFVIAASLIAIAIGAGVATAGIMRDNEVCAIVMPPMSHHPKR